ncbi:hypothetical protein D3C76_1755360 [compost metagenome]
MLSTVLFPPGEVQVAVVIVARDKSRPQDDVQVTFGTKVVSVAFITSTSVKLDAPD